MTELADWCADQILRASVDGAADGMALALRVLARSESVDAATAEISALLAHVKAKGVDEVKRRVASVKEGLKEGGL